MLRVIPITGALVAAMLATAPGALAGQESGRSPWPNVGRDTGTTAALADTAFIRQVIRGNLTEVGLSRLADSRAADSAVEEFAERMISDHESMNQQWGAVARNNRMRAEVTLGRAKDPAIERLEGLSGAAFDKAYMGEMIRRHEQDLVTFQRMATSAGSAEVRQLANSGASSIREHLALARQVGSRVGVSATAARTGGVITPTPAPSNDDRSRTTAGTTRDEADDRNARGTLQAQDRAFVQNVLQDHLMHLRLADRAQHEARDDETRQFADRLEEDLEDWQERWKALAERFDVKPPSNLGRLHGQKVEKLERASKGNFDRTYATMVTEHLASIVPYFEKEGQAVRSASVRRLVEEELPVIRQHLARAQRLQGQASARAEGSDRQ